METVQQQPEQPKQPEQQPEKQKQRPFPTLYGRNGYPSTFQTAKIPSDVLEYILKVPNFINMPENKIQELYTRNVDHKGVPNHVYYEGYFQCLSLKPIPSIHPRYGYSYPKPSAPTPLFAFLSSFKKLNSKLLDDIVNYEEENPSTNSALSLLKTLIKEGKAFSDLSVQFHYGDEIGEENVAWHVDGANSVLHMALSMSGTRAVHSKQSKVPNGESEISIDWETAGDIYITSPFCFNHGVQYPACEWENKICAIQCRFLLTDENYLEMTKRYDSWKGMMAVVTNVLSNAEIFIPTIEDVKNEEKILLQQQKRSSISILYQKFLGLF